MQNDRRNQSENPLASRMLFANKEKSAGSFARQPLLFSLTNIVKNVLFLKVFFHDRHMTGLPPIQNRMCCSMLHIPKSIIKIQSRVSLTDQKFPCLHAKVESAIKTHVMVRFKLEKMHWIINNNIGKNKTTNEICYSSSIFYLCENSFFNGLQTLKNLALAHYDMLQSVNTILLRTTYLCY